MSERLPPPKPGHPPRVPKAAEMHRRSRSRSRSRERSTPVVATPASGLFDILGVMERGQGFVYAELYKHDVPTTESFYGWDTFVATHVSYAELMTAAAAAEAAGVPFCVVENLDEHTFIVKLLLIPLSAALQPRPQSDGDNSSSGGEDDEEKAESSSANRLPRLINKGFTPCVWSRAETLGDAIPWYHFQRVDAGGKGTVNSAVDALYRVLPDAARLYYVLSLAPRIRVAEFPSAAAAEALLAKHEADRTEAAASAAAAVATTTTASDYVQ